ncbi:MAG: cysteine desulfurase [Bacteroidia bacterium]|nr:cysteine desulfurase [Bacteroidia bacterium]
MISTKRVYLDNAATTPMDDLVIEAMTNVMKNTYGNPSATHSLGRSSKAVIETSRKSIAKAINAESREIIFTSGGTEADNMAIRCAVKDLGLRNIITSPVEHKAVLETSKELAQEDGVELHLVNVDGQGRVDLVHLRELAEQNPGAIISLMHANNELGTLLDYKTVSEIARANNCLFHSDTVQTMGHYAFDVQEFGADMLTCSAHKLNGPKGIGFLYVNKALNFKPMITGGGQESNHRAGTENVVGIVGLAKALEIAFNNLEEEQNHISGIKNYMMSEIEKNLPSVSFNGDTSYEGGLYTVLNCSLPPQENNALLLFQMDIEGVCCSGGSACNSGATKGSHVLEAINHPQDRQAIRFSFGRYTTTDDIDFAINALRKLLKPETVQV